MDDGEIDIRSELRNGLLLAYIDGAVDEETRRQIDELLLRDPELSAEARHLAEAEAVLERRLQPAGGPSHHELGEYALGLLPRAQAARLERQLTGNPELQRELEETRRYLADLDLPRTTQSTESNSWTERVSVTIARLIGVPPVPAFGGLRGRQTAPYTYEIDGGQLILEIQTDSTNPARRVIVGMVAGVESPEALTTRLYGPEEPAFTGPVDELGNFVLGGIPPDTYDLTLHNDTLEILVPKVEVT